MRRVRDLSPYIGQTIKAKILELDKNRNNVVLSRRQYLEETQSEVRETFLSQLKRARFAKVSCPPSSTSVHSLIWAVLTA